MYVSLNAATCVELNFYVMDNLEINNKEKKKQTAFNLNLKKKQVFIILCILTRLRSL